jgi:hypothetical protein
MQFAYSLFLFSSDVVDLNFFALGLADFLISISMIQGVVSLPSSGCGCGIKPLDPCHLHARFRPKTF